MEQMSSMAWKILPLLRKNAKDIAIGVVSGLVIANAFFLNSAYADMDTGPRYPDDATVALLIGAMQNETLPYGELPAAKDAEPRHLLTVPITAYTSDLAQTDNTPCIAARGFDLCAHDEEDVIATNFLPMGTKIRIPDLYGNRVFTVVDRMNKRYDRHVDIWMREYSDAKSFGLKFATIEVF
ncbi:hypothetical protein A2348_01830 [Candidatus Uhrbacteria bacterium RIFOXYB12_FULL_58_10]|uniref:3D domain-containing protein n=1 Tax=Candidatus Uhrbacteria bacterium RIFOXYB2_FULL_57_15 TaxID=1802422 RepID=A0A1F7W657_9BACT|nr:MAG: hypothetical protein A2348_01830 [Candidatus Uhrbacteria bacterium RIFOXYB12_FULL_58_10]OGL97858.1 MAG: hypothetical protein A2304_04735 [Candidatus Uhrbacteria bacterium RIFOXYB2_FULL_57_15]OGM00467.1 MAG: hypothetical protein A2501_00700 [Candidatus Uhrbacteria bacterium RIFOXYC12_FULL_57_11]